MSKKFINRRFFDFAPFTGDRVITPEGYLEVNVVATAVGVQEYDASELGGSPGEIIGLHRTAETVFDPATIDSFNGKPVTIGHDGEMISSDTHKIFSVGNVMTEAKAINDKEIGVRILITDPDAVRRANDNELVGVSLGYTCNQVEGTGAVDGKEFALVTDGPMLINHVTLLPSSMPPRVESARILDTSKKDSIMDPEEMKKIADALAPMIKTQVADAVADAMKAKADANADAEDKVDAEVDVEDKADVDVDVEDEPKADAATVTLTDAQLTERVSVIADQRAQVLALCDAVGSGKSNEAILKDKLGSDYVNVDQAIGFLTASNKLDADGRARAVEGISDAKTGGNFVVSLDALSKLDAASATKES